MWIRKLIGRLPKKQQQQQNAYLAKIPVRVCTEDYGYTL